MLDNINHKKIAIILFNLGGPDSLKSVKPFLFNLFYDPAIIRFPSPIRWVIAKLISIFRDKKAQGIYANTGNKSPILEETIKQKNALTISLQAQTNFDFEIFICMRYWHPRSREVISKVKEYNPTEVVLLPLYPQFSTTTTGSSIKEFKQSFGKTNMPIKTINSYYEDENFIKAHVTLIKIELKKLKTSSNYRILFSAHGLPEKIIKQGDQYQFQIEQTVKKVVKSLAIDKLDYKITYQSRVGPVKWLEPNTEDEIIKAGIEGKSLIIVPIAFVSEHVETLVELDIEYKEVAKRYKIEYFRVPTLSTNEFFIEALRDLVMKAVTAPSAR